MVTTERTTEFGFELQVCQWAEHHWPPESHRTNTGGTNRDAPPILVARQLGTKRRRWDTIVIECEPAAFKHRAHFGPQRLDSNLRHVVAHAPQVWAWYRDCLPKPSYPWRYVREAVHEAADRGLIDRRRGNGGRIELRRKWPYENWVRRIIAIENKPDLDASAARALASQLERDVAMRLADEVWVCTRATDEAIEPILLADMPVEVGVLTLIEGRRGKQAAAVEWQPRALAVEQPGIRILEQPSDAAYDASATRFEYTDVEWKAQKRLDIAERAYERGWRGYIDGMRPDCRHFELQPTEAVARPTCRAKGCQQTPRECAASCPDVEPEPPAWRQMGWPIEGGPGKGIKSLLERQRGRMRPTDEE